VFGEQSKKTRIFTPALEAGRIACQKTCARCHTLTLTGRQGNPDERPEIGSLSEADRQFIASLGGTVPPLVGKIFLEHWGSATAAQLVDRFQQARFSFKEAGLTDDEEIVNITAYILSLNGAKPGDRPLTRMTDTVVNSALE
jgi:hypothetical protein